MSSETYFNASEAAEHTGKSLPTIRHYLNAGKFPNATQTPKGKVKVWKIPLTDLVASGLLDRVSGSKQPTKQELADTHSEALLRDIDRLELELRHARELLARTEQELDTYKQRERQLFAALETRETQDRRRSLWQRLAGK